MTREQFLQQRKEVAQVVRRKNILPCLLFFIPLFMLPFLFNKEKLPTSSQEWFLLGSLSSVLFLGTLWTFYRMYADAKLNAIHCPSCGKNNGGHKASGWLIATGKCLHCAERMIQEDQTESRPVISRAAYEHQLKKMDSQLAKVALCVGIPFVIALTVMNVQELYLLDIEFNTGLQVIFGCTALIGLIGLGWLASRIENRSGTMCPACHRLPSYYRRKITLATGNCAACGHAVFENNLSSSPA